jgi:cytochrome c oxidase subunit III
MPTWPVPDFVFAKVPFLHIEAPLVFVTFMTFVLIISSVTMVRAVQEGHRENKGGVIKWMLWTIVGGATFLACQAWEWTTLIAAEGMTVTTDPFSNHMESGVYLSGAELERAGFSKHKIELHGGHGHDDHGHGAAERYYYLPPGAADIDENRYFEKIDHYGHNFSGEEFKAGDPYLITYAHDSHLYEPGAMKTSGGEITKEHFGPVAFGSLFFFITGFHGFHVLSGVAFLLIIVINVASGLYVERKNGYEMVEKMGLYWHFVDLVWVFVFLVFYLL